MPVQPDPKPRVTRKQTALEVGQAATAHGIVHPFPPLLYIHFF